jgi:mannose/fructose/N-acetylgalactosamine-specific phosphotransferase system component IID
MTGPEIFWAVVWFFSLVGVYIWTEETAYKKGYKAGVKAMSQARTRYMRMGGENEQIH